MDDDKCSPIDREPARRPSKGRGEENRRTRLEKGLPPELVDWLHRVTRVHAHLLSVVRLYGNPSQAGGKSLEGEAYAARAARGDRTLLYDALTVSRDELDEIRSDVFKAMEAAPPTPHRPGTPGKIDVMAERVARGESTFIEGDAPIDLR